MREIKFRGKRKDNGEWVYGYYLVAAGMPFISTFASKSPIIVQPETVGQFTGIYDKNGKEIYEGDVVNQKFEKHIIQGFDGEWSDIYGFHRGTVKISPSKGTVISTCYTEFDEDLTSIDYYQKPRTQYGVKIVGYRCEVIGNIHDKE